MSFKIPYDPDFDRAQRDFDTSPQQSTSSDSPGGFFTNASPKLTFVFGAVLGLAVISFIGFIILLVKK